MSNSPWVRDVDEAGFQAEVIEASRERPVLVDFWAAWCGPCRMLGPVLERIAADFDGAVLVAKVDTDANPGLAQRYRISGIPACKLFVAGEIADEFVGALPQAAVREFLGRYVVSELDREIAVAIEARQAGDLDRAAELIAAIVAAHPDHPVALVEAARVALARGEADLVAERARAVPITADQYDTARALLSSADLLRTCTEAGGLEAAQAAGDRYAVAACHAVAGDWRPALDTLLEIVRGDDRARQAMLAIFVLCEDDELARAYRRKLAIAT